MKLEVLVLLLWSVKVSGKGFHNTKFGTKLTVFAACQYILLLFSMMNIFWGVIHNRIIIN